MSREPDHRLEDAFRAYISFVQQTWNDLRNETASGSSLLLLRPKAEILFAAVSAAEQSNHFDKFCSSMIDWRTAMTGEPVAEERRQFAEESLRCWLRRSRTYQEVCGGAPADDRALVSRLKHDLAAGGQQIRHFAPITNVNFSGNLEFAWYQILKLDEGELDLELRNDVNRIFYPHAVVDTRSLSNYWFLEATESVNVPGFDEALVFGTAADFNASDLPEPVEAALESICLYDWERLLHSAGGVLTVVANGRMSVPRPMFPGVVSISDWLFDAPRPAPAWFLKPDLWEQPVFDFNTPEATMEFQIELLRIINLLESVKAAFPFVHAAARFIVKGFLSAGLDQLLWHITAIESLLGEQSGNLVDTLRRRLSIILGTTEKDKKAVRKEFAELYDFRSRLVHGDLKELKTAGVHLGHLITARQVALGAWRWMAHWLKALLTTWPEGQDLPSREDMLRLLDMPSDSKLRLKALLNGPASAQPDTVPPLTRQPIFRDPYP